MVLNSQRTVYGVDLELHRLAGMDYNIINNTSLNEKFSLYTEEEVPEGVYPTLKYLTIGTGEVDIIDNNLGYSYSRHSPVDAALFNHIPFVMKPVDEDLLPAEQTAYRFRKEEVIDGVTYAAYYLKVIDTIELRSDFYKVSTQNGVSSLSLFDTNDDALLYPVPKDRSASALDISTAEYVIKVLKLDFALTTAEITELKNVLTLKNLDNVNITEIGLCTGIDKYIDNKFVATAVQISHHIGVNIELAIYLNTNTTFLRSIELGGGEPLML